MKNVIAFGILILYYGLVVYLIVGITYWYATIFLSILGFICTFVIAEFLKHPLIHDYQYEPNHRYLVIIGTQIVLFTVSILLLGAVVDILYVRISPLLGHLTFIGMFIVQAGILYSERSKKWVRMMVTYYLATYACFSVYFLVNIMLLPILLFGIVVESIAIVSYGVLKYIPLFQLKQ